MDMVVVKHRYSCSSWQKARQGQYVLLFLHEETPGEARGQEIKDTRGQVEDRAQTGLECCRTSTINHHNFMNLFRILMSQEGTKRDTAQRKKMLKLA